MKELMTILVAAAAFAAPAAYADTQTAPDAVIHASRQDQTAINRLLADYAAALKTESPQAVAALFTADGVVMPYSSPTAAGKQGLEGNYSGLFANVGLDLDFTVLEMNVLSRYAFVRSTSKGPVTVKSTRQTAPDDFRELWVMEKVNGQWKIARYMFNQSH